MNQDPPYLLLYCINTGKKKISFCSDKKNKESYKEMICFV